MIHGGGWRTGDKANAAMTRHKPAHFVGAGYVYASINYTLTATRQDPAHPAHVQDVAAALAWVHDTIDAYGGDPDRLFVMGHSAGAHLAALVATDPARLAAHDKPLTIIKGVIALDSAAYDIPRSMHELRIGPSMRRMYANAFGDDEAAWRDASPRHHVAADAGIAPMLLIHTGSRTRGRLPSEDMAAALRDAGVPALAAHAPDQDHAGINMAIGQPGDRYTDLVMRFLADPAGVQSLTLRAAAGNAAQEDHSSDQDEAIDARLRALFDRLDRDGDGHLSRQEFARLRRALVTHDALDADGDGLVRMDEAAKHPALAGHSRRDGRSPGQDAALMSPHSGHTPTPAPSS